MAKKPPGRPPTDEERQRVVADLPVSLVEAIDQRRGSRFTRVEWMERGLRWALDQPVETAPVDRRRL